MQNFAMSTTPAFVHDTFHSNIVVQMFSKDSKDSGTAGGAFAGWLNQNYVDRSEFERQLAHLTADITSRISNRIETQRSGHSSSFVLPLGAQAVSEEVSDRVGISLLSLTKRPAENLTKQSQQPICLLDS